MAEAQVLRRMAEARRTEPEAGPELRILGAALQRASEAELGLAVAVEGIASGAATLAELPERLEERGLLLLIEAPGERVGLAALSPGLVAAMIEMQTVGALTGAEPSARRPTRTDAALCVPWIERLLRVTDSAAEEGGWAAWEAGFRCASTVEDARLLPLLLDDTRFRLFRPDLTLGPDRKRRGALLLALPEKREPLAAAAQSAADEADWTARLCEAVLPGEARVSAILGRVLRPLAEVLALEPGMVLRLPMDALGQVRLEGWGRRLLGHAKLGQYRGYLAVRLTGESLPATEAAEFSPTQSSPAKAANPEPQTAAG